MKYLEALVALAAKVVASGIGDLLLTRFCQALGITDLMAAEANDTGELNRGLKLELRRFAWIADVNINFRLFA